MLAWSDTALISPHVQQVRILEENDVTFLHTVSEVWRSLRILCSKLVSKGLQNELKRYTQQKKLAKLLFCRKLLNVNCLTESGRKGSKAVSSHQAAN